MAVKEGRLKVGVTDEQLDTAIVTQADGEEAHREGIFYGSPTEAKRRVEPVNMTPQFKDADDKAEWAMPVLDPHSTSIVNALNALYDQSTQTAEILASLYRTQTQQVQEDGEIIFSCKPWEVHKAPLGTEEIWVMEDYVTAFSVHKSVSLTAQGTTIITTPSGEGSIVLVDVILSARKANGALISLEWDDGSNQETIFSALLTNEPIPFGAWSVKGRVQGWRDARLELVLADTNTTVFMTCVYMKLPAGLLFSEWQDLQ